MISQRHQHTDVLQSSPLIVYSLSFDRRESQHTLSCCFLPICAMILLSLFPDPEPIPSSMLTDTSAQSFDWYTSSVLRGTASGLRPLFALDCLICLISMVGETILLLAGNRWGEQEKESDEKVLRIDAVSTRSYRSSNTDEEEQCQSFKICEVQKITDQEVRAQRPGSK